MDLYRTLIFLTVGVEAKYERCVPFDCTLIEGTGVVERFLGSSIEVFHPLERPGGLTFFLKNENL